MKKLVLSVICLLAALPAQAADMNNMQMLQQYQHSKPNAQNYLNSLRQADDTPVMIRQSGRGHFFMPVSINGQEITMMADTGASAIFLSPDAARRAGINMGTLNYNITYHTANGTVMGARTNVKTLQLGSIYMEDVPVTVSQKGEGDMALLGMDFFQRLSRYEVRDGVLILYR